MANFQADWGIARDESGLPTRARIQHPPPARHLLFRHLERFMGRRDFEWPGCVLRGTSLDLHWCLHHNCLGMQFNPTFVLSFTSNYVISTAPPSVAHPRLDRRSSREQAHDARLSLHQLLIHHGLGRHVYLGCLSLDVCDLALFCGYDGRLLCCACCHHGPCCRVPIQFQKG
jgi:hypothetical protein